MGGASRQHQRDSPADEGRSHSRSLHGLECTDPRWGASRHCPATAARSPACRAIPHSAAYGPAVPTPARRGSRAVPERACACTRRRRTLISARPLARECPAGSPTVAMSSASTGPGSAVYRFREQIVASSMPRRVSGSRGREGMRGSSPPTNAGPRSASRSRNRRTRRTHPVQLAHAARVCVHRLDTRGSFCGHGSCAGRSR